VFVSQPVPQTVSVGKTATFNATATGDLPLNYTWYFNANTPVPRGSNSSLTLPGITLAQAGAYYVVVANNVGSITSSPALLTVLPASTLTLSPLPGGFRISSIGLPGDIFWLEVSTNLAQPITWTRTATNVADAIGLVQFIDTASGPAKFYRLVSPTTIPSLPVFVEGPVNRTVLAGKSASFNVLVSGALPLIYQWYFNGQTPLPAGTNASLQVSVPGAGNYCVIASNGYGSATSEVVSVTVVPPPRLTAQLANSAFQFTGVAVAGDTYWVQMAASLASPVKWVTVATNVVGANGLIQFSDTNATLQFNRYYRLVFP